MEEGDEHGLCGRRGHGPQELPRKASGGRVKKDRELWLYMFNFSILGFSATDVTIMATGLSSLQDSL